MINKLWFWHWFAAAGWVLAFWGSYAQGNMIRQWQGAALEMFQRACSEEQGLFFVGTLHPGHMIEFNCYHNHGSGKGQGPMFSLPPMPDDGARP